MGFTRCRHRVVRSVDDARHRHHSQAFECRIRDRARASKLGTEQLHARRALGIDWA